MGSPETPAPSSEFLEAFAAQADANATMTFASFMELALYHPKLGYYQRPRTRVGYAPGTDFFTASSSGPIFGELIAAACATLLGNPQDYTFVEIGAERARDRFNASRDGSKNSDEAGVLAGISHPFAATRTLSLGNLLDMKGKCIVFSNELFDAQPCHRFVFRRGAWRELGVQLRDGRLSEFEFPEISSQSRTTLAKILRLQLPESTEGAIIDAPLAAVGLLEKIAAQPWKGLFIACDYGKSWAELSAGAPAGTVRAYHRHRQSNDLLSRPGEQDLTCHVCWDWLEEALQRHGFATPTLESQESFFVHHAGAFIAATVQAEAAHYSQKKLSLLQLLHPAQMGQKFQVLHALRR